MLFNYNIRSHISLFSLILLFSCNADKPNIIPKDGYKWPSQERFYWPTENWISSSMEDHNIDPLKMNLANQFAENDPLARALLVIKDGYIVFENYYGDGWLVIADDSTVEVGGSADSKTVSYLH